ncbi:helix-turn-helix transcriptional regulator [Rhizobium rhizogenes]|uniref:helix-turn-helix domain-containing protein n=1 Tax=Rhizobium rhizogenes TaxID=359 RepID=UPI00166D9BD7|nr:helix-turn-helix transcriptional regulator [Rhizobium rhizogenes]
MRGKQTNRDTEILDDWRVIIRDLLKESGKPQKEVANAAAITTGTLYAFIAADAAISLVKLERLLDFFGYDLEAVKRVADEPNIRKRTRPVATRCTESAGAM